MVLYALKILCSFIINWDHFPASRKEELMNCHKKSSLYVLLISVYWCLGLIIGAFVVSQITLNTFSLMRSCFYGRSSIVVHLLILNIPLFLSVITVASAKPLLMVPVLFIKAFLLSVCWFVFYSAYGNAGWLTPFTVLFPDIITSIVLIFFIFRNIPHRKASFLTDFLINLVIVIIIGFIDHAVISPLWLDIINV